MKTDHKNSKQNNFNATNGLKYNVPQNTNIKCKYLYKYKIKIQNANKKCKNKMQIQTHMQHTNKK